MPAARRAGQQQSLLPAVIIGGLAALGLGVWYGLPGPAAVVVALLVWAWTDPQPLLTGPKKPGTSNPTAQGPAEEKKLVTFQTAQQARFAPVTSAWVPGWPLQGSFLLGVALAALACTMPVQELWMMAASALGVFTGVAGFAAARRAVTGNPGSTVKTLGELAGAKGTLVKLIAFGVGGGLVGGVAGQVLNQVLVMSPAGPAPVPWLLTAASALVGAGVGVGVPWRAEALKDWRELCGVREEWKPRWPLIKFDPEPVATETSTVGPFRFTTFDCQGAKGSQDLFNLAGKLDAVLPSGTGYAICPSPMEFKTGPELGTIHPSKAQIVTWDQTEWPDLTQVACEPDIAEAACQVALAAGSLANAMAPVIATEVAPVHTEESGSAMWMASLTMSTGAAGSARAGGCGSGGLTAGMLGWTALDHRQQVVRLYFGDPGADLDPQVAKALDVVQEEDTWTQAWLASLKTNVNPPALQPAQSRTATLANGATVERAAFAVRLGVDVTTMMTAQIERNLSTAFQGTTFVTINGWTEGVQGRPGERHTGAFAVYKSRDGRLPPSPEQMGPRPGSQGPAWMMSGFFNHAFDSLRVPRPEVVSAKALTKPDSRGHIWEVRLRLYGGVTFGDVRTQSERLRQALGVSWLRVQDAEDGCVVFCGAPWRRVQLANPRRDVERVTRLDWTQAMTDAKVSGAGNRVPELVSTSTLPNNEQVQRLEFDLPPGVDKEMLGKARQKLMTSTGSEYLEYRRSERGASSISVLVSEKDPMPTYAPFDRAYSAKVKTVPFCVGVEGEPLDFNIDETPHVLILGGSGSGKSAALQTLITGCLVKGFELFVIDPTKGGADFRFAQPWARAFAVDVWEAEACMRAVYSEVVRRKNLNSQHGARSYLELPEQVRPQPVIVVVDEFTSLMGGEVVDKTPSDDPEVEAGRQFKIAENNARRSIGNFVGKLAREARSAGVVLLLATQKLSADDLAKVGSRDTKDNMARLLLGKTTYGAKQSGLISPEDAADLGDVVPKGRGLYETSSMSGTPVQVWYADPDDLVAAISETRPPLDDADRVDLTALVRKPEEDDGPAIQAVSIDEVAPLLEVVELGEMDVDLAELDALADLMDEDEDDPEPDGAEPELVPAPQDEDDPDAELAALWGVSARNDVDPETELADLWASHTGAAESDTPPEVEAPADLPANDGLFANLDDLWTDRDTDDDNDTDPDGETAGQFDGIDWSSETAPDPAPEPEPAVTLPPDPWRGLSGWDDDE